MASVITQYFNWFLDWLKAFFWKQEMEICIVGLEGVGKTTLVNIMANGEFLEDLIPTMGFNMRKIKKGNVLMKVWDLGGQTRFRAMWERYCKGVDAIVYILDGSNKSKIPESLKELKELLSKPQLANIPLLVLSNKNDLGDSLNTDQTIEILNLKSIVDREVCCYSISAKNGNNIDLTLKWLTEHSRTV